MSLEEIARYLSDRLQVEVCSAGIWRYDEHRKKVPQRTTTYPSKWIEGTNLLQVFLDSTSQLICIDADGIPLEALEAMYPSIKNTFTTRTTREDKRHYWFKTRAEQKLPVTRIRGDQFDVISAGFMFEGHSLPTQSISWEIVNDAELAYLTPEEVKRVHDLRPSQAAHSTSQHHTMFIDRDMHSMVEKIVESGKMDRRGTTEKEAIIPKKEWKPLALSLMNENERSKHSKYKKRVELPELNYMDFNTVAYKLSYNALIGHEMRDKFIELLIRDYYKKPLDSSRTRTALAQILCNLPRHNALDDILLQSESLVEDMQHTIINGYGLVKYIDNKSVFFMEIDTKTMKPRRLGKNDDPSMSLSTVTQLRGLTKEEIACVPLIKILTDPFGPRVAYCDLSDIDTLNLAEHSIYYERAVPQSQMPENFIMRVITSYMGREFDRDFYLHWLAHAMFGDRSPQTVPMLVTDKTVRGSTGKTTLAQAIPTRLITMCNTIEVSSADTGYADTLVGKRLAAFNDVPPLSSSAWKSIHGVIRDRTTAGARRQDNMKYGNFAVTSASLAFTWSSNWIPGIDEHDRRLWYILPHNVEPYGTEPRLSEADALEVNRLFENSTIDFYSEPLQALANYLLYLYKEEKDKYYNYLFTEAPRTMGREIALKNDKNYSEQLLPAIKEGPEALVDIIGTDDFIVDMMKFMMFQYQPDREYLTLPWEFFGDLLWHLHGAEDEKKSKKAQVVSALQVSSGAFGNQSAGTTRYKDRQELTKHGLEPDYAEYSMQQMRIDMSTTVYSKYVKYVGDRLC